MRLFLGCTHGRVARAMLNPALAVLAAVSLVPSSAAGPSCPATIVQCDYSSSARADSAARGDCSTGVGSQAYWEYYLPRGEMLAGASGRDARSAVTIHDVYQVTGVAAGTPLTFTALLHARLSQCSPQHLGSGGASAGIAEGSNGVSAQAPGGIGGCFGNEQYLEIVLTHAAGESFQLDLSISVSADANVAGETYGDAWAALSFLDLPPGALVTSCHGFRSDLTTAVRARTWGSLKARYR